MKSPDSPATERPKEFTGDDATTRIKSFLDTVEQCPSACYNEVITVHVEREKLSVSVTAANRCGDGPATKQKADERNLGCASGQSAPTTAVKVTGLAQRTETPRSRCDTTSNAASALNTAMTRVPQDKLLQGLAQKAATDADLSTPLGKEQTAGVLKAFGVSDADATRLVENKPDETKALLQAFASGDEAQVQHAAATAGVTLNPDLSDIKNLSPQQVSDKFSGLYTEEQKQQAQSLQTTGFQQPVRSAPQAILPGGKYGELLKRVEDQAGLSTIAPGVLAKTMKIETGGNCNSVSPTGPAGCFQYSGTTWDKWSAAINNGVPLDRSLRYDAEVSAKVTANYMAANWNKYGDLIQRSGMDPAAALYTIHNVGDGGGPRFIAAYAQNPNARVADVLDVNSIRYNPGLYGNGNITLAQAEQNMVARMTGSTNFAGGTIASQGSPFGGVPQTGWDYYAPSTPYGVSSSPFGNVFTPVSTGGPVSTGAPVSTGNPVSTGGAISTGGTITTGAAGTGTTVPPAQPVASIIVQPTSTVAGDPVRVSWSSFGMSGAQPCQIFAGASFIAQSNEGSRTFDTKGATTSVQFLLQCFAPNGSAIKQTALVQIR